MSLFRALRRVPRATNILRNPISNSRRNFSRNDLFKVSEEVEEAVATGKPVIALETTIYTHGWPYPENVALASHLESLVRVNGGIPATIGVLNGVARVGMSPEELIELTESIDHQKVWKISRRDLGFITGMGLNGRVMNGGTTIAGTMVLAHLAGIKIFATGGLGGVHRGGENSMDISADLTELGRTPVTVISSGCKSFLDIPRTLEYLETQGVGVGTFADGRSGAVDFPAFFSRDSGTKSPQVIKDEAEAAAIIYAQSKLQLQSGLHFANPVPENAGIPKSQMDSIIAKAVQMADEAGVGGSDNTPFILRKIKELSEGQSVLANKALVASNVVRGTKVAVELAKLELRENPILERDDTAISARYMPKPVMQGSDIQGIPTSARGAIDAPDSKQKVDILVAGSLASDLICDYVPLPGFESKVSPEPFTKNPSKFFSSVGGVGHNVAYASHLAGASVILSSAVADDPSGDSLVSRLEQNGMDVSGIVRLKTSEGASTAQYVAVNDAKKELVLAMSDFDILSSPKLADQNLWKSVIAAHNPTWVFIDGNWSAKILNRLIYAAKEAGKPVAFEPVSKEKASRLLQRASEIVQADSVFPAHKIDLASPNAFELETMYNSARDALLFESEAWWHIIDQLGLSSAGSRDKFVNITNVTLVDRGIPQQTIQLLPFIPCLVTKLGTDGCLLTQLLQRDDPRLTDPGCAPYILSRSAYEDTNVGGVYMRLFSAAEVLTDGEVVSVNGVGDTMVGVLMAGLVRRPGVNVEDVIPVAQKAAVQTLKSAEAVSGDVGSLKMILDRV